MTKERKFQLKNFTCKFAGQTNRPDTAVSINLNRTTILSRDEKFINKDNIFKTGREREG